MLEATMPQAAEQTCRESEETFRRFVANVRAYALIQLDSRATISGWNTGAEQIFGFEENEILGRPIWVLYASEGAAGHDTEKDFEEALDHGYSERERWLLRRDGARFLARWVTTPMRDEQGRLQGYTQILYDETTRKESEDQLKTALEEKETLVQEIHHRVKNNLQVVGSLLSIQKIRIEDPQMRAILDDAQSRVRAIAALHERLYASPEFSNVHFGGYMEQLVLDLFAFYAVNKRQIELRLNSADVVLDVNQAMPLGLIINELVVNALKHAFPNSRTGFLEVDLAYLGKSNEFKEGETLDQGFARLTVFDSGIGLMPGTKIDQAQSMGFHLVDMLAKQVHGTLDIGTAQGTSIAVTFPLTLA